MKMTIKYPCVTFISAARIVLGSNSLYSSLNNRALGCTDRGPPHVAGGQCSTRPKARKSPVPASWRLNFDSASAFKFGHQALSLVSPVKQKPRI